MTPPEPKRVLQYFSWKDQEQWQATSPTARMEWLEFVIMAAWAGAANEQRILMDPPPKAAGDDIV